MCHEYVGVIHIHTTASDGCGTFEEVVASGKKAGLDFLIITDHDVLQHKEKEGWYGRLLVLVGEEISPPKAHYLALNIQRAIPPSSNPQSYIDEVNRQKGFGFITHPYHKERRLPFLPPHPWEDFPMYSFFQGIEIWSLMYDWVKKVNFLTLPYYLLFPIRHLSGPPPRLLKEWDRLCKKEKIVGIAGLDVHGNKVFPFSIFSYTFTFRTLRTHIWCKKLTGNFSQDKESVYRALKEGNSFFALDIIGDSKGFLFTTEMGDLPGSVVKLRKPMYLRFFSPLKANFRFIHNGKILKKIFGKRGELKIEKGGVYRLEGYLKNKPWLFTNPFWIEDEDFHFKK